MLDSLKLFFDKAYEIGLFGLASVLIGWIFWLMLALPVYLLFGSDWANNSFFILWGGGCGGVWLGMRIANDRSIKKQ